MGQRVFLTLAQKYGTYYLVTIKPYKTVKIKIKKKKPESFPCSLCKAYIDRVGFLEKIKKPELFFKEQVIFQMLVKTYLQLTKSYAIIKAT